MTCHKKVFCRPPPPRWVPYYRLESTLPLRGGLRHIGFTHGYHSGRGCHGNGACCHCNTLVCHGNIGILHQGAKLRSRATWPTWSALVTCSGVMQNPYISILLPQKKIFLVHLGVYHLSILFYNSRRFKGNFCIQGRRQWGKSTSETEKNLLKIDVIFDCYIKWQWWWKIGEKTGKNQFSLRFSFVNLKIFWKFLLLIASLHISIILIYLKNWNWLGFRWIKHWSWNYSVLPLQVII